jgi:hypothetical protein
MRQRLRSASAVADARKSAGLVDLEPNQVVEKGSHFAVPVLLNSLTSSIDQLLANPYEGPGAQEKPIREHHAKMIGDSWQRKLIPGRYLK